ncbi:alanyl-tRNA synthetase [Serratia phage Moabite]|uniref:Alanyl-tRNA synthetase n=1 Tax=Serratia phage Moabite TaxID=2587814 RepID=A0A4Y5TPF4_9CAUD|nr:alanyl-tRNA synthetase [Serratia phage Moabite]QDB71265.1 alanyl-tRNA synthetase [Serratia phage Moabite]
MYSELSRRNEDVIESKMSEPRQKRMEVVGYKMEVTSMYSGNQVFPGDRLFELKATHGVPLEISVAAILNKGKVIDWGQFIEQARRNKFWDFQILDMITNAVQDAGTDPDYIAGVVERTKFYMLKNPLLNKSK